MIVHISGQPSGSGLLKFGTYKTSHSGEFGVLNSFIRLIQNQAVTIVSSDISVAMFVHGVAVVDSTEASTRSQFQA